jgi:diacylglycerol O-acyltransferase / trehalose O-mycolyltransferase
MAYAARHPGLFEAAASYSGVVSTLRHPAVARGIAALGTSDPDALWGSPTAQRRVWAAHDPSQLAPRLRGTRVFVSCGDGTAGPFDRPGRTDPVEASLHGENVEFARRLRASGVPGTVDLYGPGTHSWPYWQRELHRSLPLLLRDLG